MSFEEYINLIKIELNKLTINIKQIETYECDNCLPSVSNLKVFDKINNISTYVSNIEKLR